LRATYLFASILPGLRSKPALFRRDAAKALAESEPAIPNDTGATPLPFYPVFVRGEAQLPAKRGKQAAEAYPGRSATPKRASAPVWAKSTQRYISVDL